MSKLMTSLHPLASSVSKTVRHMPHAGAEHMMAIEEGSSQIMVPSALGNSFSSHRSLEEATFYSNIQAAWLASVPSSLPRDPHIHIPPKQPLQQNLLLSPLGDQLINSTSQSPLSLLKTPGVPIGNLNPSQLPSLSPSVPSSLSLPPCLPSFPPFFSRCWRSNPEPHGKHSTTELHC